MVTGSPRSLSQKCSDWSVSYMVALLKTHYQSDLQDSRYVDDNAQAAPSLTLKSRRLCCHLSVHCHVVLTSCSCCNRLGGLTQQTSVGSQFWCLGVQNQGVGWCAPLLKLWGEPIFPFSSSPWQQKPSCSRLSAPHSRLCLFPSRFPPLSMLSSQSHHYKDACHWSYVLPG